MTPQLYAPRSMPYSLNNHMEINISKLIAALENELETAERCNIDGEILTMFQFDLSKNLGLEEDRGKTELTVDELNAIILRTGEGVMAACGESLNEAEAYIWELAGQDVPTQEL